MNALLICSEPDESALLSYALHRTGLSTTTIDTLDHAPETLRSARFDMVLSAANLDPAEVCQTVRKASEAALVLLVYTHQEDSAVHALEDGADLIVMRPYNMRLLIAQFKALLRCSRLSTAADLPRYSVGALSLDPTTRMVQIEGRQPRRLTQLEFRLLHTLMMEEGRTVTSGSIVERVWGFDGAGGMELVRGLVRRLRAKVEADPRHPRLVLTEPGIGYRLDTSSLRPPQ